MQTENDTSKPGTEPKQEAGEGCSGATCSSSLWRCENCKHWERSSATYGECRNDAKIHEDDSRKVTETDHLIYCYYESGGFSTGKNFGCVHFSQPNVQGDGSPSQDSRE